MNWRFVVQPDGLLARFCDELMDFTDFALTEEEALAECHRIRMKPDAAKRLVHEALEECCQVSGLPEGPLHRWREALHTIRLEHGQSHYEFALSEMGFASHAVAKSGAMSRSGNISASTA